MQSKIVLWPLKFQMRNTPQKSYNLSIKTHILITRIVVFEDIFLESYRKFYINEVLCYDQITL